LDGAIDFESVAVTPPRSAHLTINALPQV